MDTCTACSGVRFNATDCSMGNYHRNKGRERVSNRARGMPIGKNCPPASRCGKRSPAGASWLSVCGCNAYNTVWKPEEALLSRTGRGTAGISCRSMARTTDSQVNVAGTMGRLRAYHHHYDCHAEWCTAAAPAVARRGRRCPAMALMAGAADLCAGCRGLGNDCRGRGRRTGRGGVVGILQPGAAHRALGRACAGDRRGSGDAAE